MSRTYKCTVCGTLLYATEVAEHKCPPIIDNKDEWRADPWMRAWCGSGRGFCIYFSGNPMKVNGKDIEDMMGFVNVISAAFRKAPASGDPLREER